MPVTPRLPLSLPADRREFLLGASALGCLAPTGLPAQTMVAQPNALASPAIEARKTSVRALTSRLTEDAKGESTLFRLLPEPAPPTTIGPPESGVFRFSAGQDGELRIANTLSQPVAFLLRGLRQSQPRAETAIPAGQEGLLAIPARQPGSFLLTAVTPGHAREQLGRGLAHLVIVEEQRPPPVDHDLPLLISDWRLDDRGVLSDRFGELADITRIGRLGTRLVVNGRIAPATMTVRPGARIRIRLANAAMARTIPLHVSGLTARVIAIDSTPCTPFDPLQRMVTLAPGARCEFIIDLPMQAGQEARVEARFASPAPLFVFRTEGERVEPRGAVVALPDPGLPAAIRLQNAARADITITGGLPRGGDANPEALQRNFADPGRIYAINGQASRPGAPLLSVRRGREIVLALRNQTAWPQVIGVAGHSFRLLHPYDDGWEPYFLDTLHLAPGSVARIAFIADIRGDHAIRSTLPDHAEAGVATFFRVT